MQPAPINDQIIRSFTARLIERTEHALPALGLAFYQGQHLEPEWLHELKRLVEDRGLFLEHVRLLDLGAAPVERLLKRQRVAGHVFSIELLPADLPDAALDQSSAVAMLNIHRDTLRDQGVTLVLWIPSSHARRFMELASNLADYRTVDIDLPLMRAEQPYPGTTLPSSTRTRHNLPLPSLGPLFIGRERELDLLHESIQEQGSGAITDALSVEGLGGIGKTRLAVEYAWAHLHEYDHLYFLRADSPDTIRSELSRLADEEWLELHLRAEMSDEDRMTAALDWFGRHRRWLVIFDNADSEESAEFLSKRVLPGFLGMGHVLITSRFARWSGGIRSVTIDSLNESEGMRMLVQATQGQRAGERDDAEIARALVQKVGGLPLALELIAAWVNARHLPLRQALEAIDEEGSGSLDWYNPRVLRYPKAVAAVWEETASNFSPAEQFLVRLFAWLSPEPVPRFFILAMNSVWTAEGIDFEAVSRGLAYRSVLNQRPDGSILLHRLLGQMERQRTPESTRQDWLLRAIQLLTAVLPTDSGDVRTWPRMRLIEAHALEMIRQCERRRPDELRFKGDEGGVSAFSILLNGLGIYHHAQARFADAESLLRLALEIDEANYGAQQPEVAGDLNNLAQVLQATNRLAEAESLMRRALEIDEARYGAQHPNVAIRLNNLALLLQDTNRVAEAEPLMRRGLEIHEASYGEQDPLVAIQLNNLATLLQATNRLAEAEPLMRRVVSIFEESLGLNHPNVASALNNLAQLLQATNRLPEAEPLMRRALEIDEASYAAQHPKVAIGLNNLASLLQYTNRVAEAEPLMRRALEIDEASYGAQHPNVATDLNNLASLLRATNRLPEAEPLMRRALEIDEASYGEKHPNVAIRLNNLASLLQATNRLAEAEPLMRRALEIDEASYGAQHPNVAIRLNNLAQLLKATNRLAEAEPLMRRALEILVESSRGMGRTHPSLKIVGDSFRRLLSAMGRTEGEIRGVLKTLAPEFFE